MIYFFVQERRRLKERYPSLALTKGDEEQCALMLDNYEQLLSSRNICEGRCALAGQTCPTGLCRAQTTVRRTSSASSGKRKTSSARSHSSNRAERTAELQRSPSVTSVTSVQSLRPRSGPAGLYSYTGELNFFLDNFRSCLHC